LEGVLWQCLHDSVFEVSSTGLLIQEVAFSSATASVGTAHTAPGSRNFRSICNEEIQLTNIHTHYKYIIFLTKSQGLILVDTLCMIQELANNTSVQQIQPLTKITFLKKSATGEATMYEVTTL
jgi:hypothetical protein